MKYEYTIADVWDIYELDITIDWKWHRTMRNKNIEYLTSYISWYVYWLNDYDVHRKFNRR